MQQIKTLIPLSEFVTIAESESENVGNEIVDFYLQVIRYNKFLQQPLELWMFVPQGYNGEVLECPDPISIGKCINKRKRIYEAIYDESEENKYNKAKEHCLFEGWKQHKEEHITNGSDVIDLISFRFYKNNVEFGVNLDKIEDLSKFNLPLTPTALKQIY